MDLESDEIRKLDQLEARYANYFQIGHNAIEFLIEFGQAYSEDLEPFLHTRIVTNPAYAKTLLIMLSDAIRKYESEFGLVAEK